MTMSILVRSRPATLLSLLAWAAVPAAAFQATPAPGAAAPAAAVSPADASPAPPAVAASPAAAPPGPPAAAVPPTAQAGPQSGTTGGAAPATDEGAVTATCRDDEPPRPSSRKLARVVGVISAPGEELRHRPRLTFQDRLSGNRWIVDQFERCRAGTSRAGRFAYSTELLPGTYDVTLAGKSYDSETASAVSLAATEVKEMDFSLVLEDTYVHPVIYTLPFVFLVSIWLIRWNNIAKPSRLAVIAQLGELQGRFPQGSWFGDALGAAQRELQQKVVVLDWLFWSRGQENASWNLAHKAELALLEDPAQTSLDKINARLASAEQRLMELDKGAARSLGQRVAAALEADPAKLGESARRQLLVEATGYIYESGDSGFAALTGWQNKSFWLTLIGVSLIWAVGISEGHAPLFLAGAVGGFLSRLTRELKRADVATDYGASWSTLFLSPVAGAISGWFGVALIMLMTDPTVGVLGGPLKVINWDSANAATLAAAFVLGFSERLFDRIVAQLDLAIDKKKEAAQKTVATASPARGAAAAGGPAAAVTALVPNPAAAGGEVAVQLGSLDGGKVTGVVLSAASGELPAFEPRFEDGELKFTVAAGTAPGTYRVVLLTPELTPPRTETDQELTVSPPAAG